MLWFEGIFPRVIRCRLGSSSTDRSITLACSVVSLELSAVSLELIVRVSLIPSAEAEVRCVKKRRVKVMTPRVDVEAIFFGCRGVLWSTWRCGLIMLSCAVCVIG